MPTGDAPTTSEWSTILLPTKVCLILEVLRYLYFCLQDTNIILSVQIYGPVSCDLVFQITLNNAEASRDYIQTLKLNIEVSVKCNTVESLYDTITFLQNTPQKTLHGSAVMGIEVLGLFFVGS